MAVAQSDFWYYNKLTWERLPIFQNKKEEIDHGTGDKRHADRPAASVRS